MFSKFQKDAISLYLEKGHSFDKSKKNIDLIRFITTDDPNPSILPIKNNSFTDLPASFIVSFLKNLPINDNKLFLSSLNTLIFKVKNIRQLIILIRIRNSLDSKEFLINHLLKNTEKIHKNKIVLQALNNETKVVAKENIKIGEILLADEPYSLAMTHNRWFACASCYVITPFLIPCPSCSDTGFCSHTCIARNVSHQFECGQTQNIRLNSYAGWNENSKLAEHSVSSPDIAHTAFMTVAKTEPHLLLEAIRKGGSNCQFLTQLRTTQFEFHHESRGFDAINQLLTNTEKFPFEKRWQYAVGAVCLTQALKLKGYPMATTASVVSDNLHFYHVCAFMMFCMQAVSTNGHHVSMVSCKANQHEDISLDQVESESFVSGLYTNLSLINHSCNPNVYRVGTVSGRILLIATAPIEKGEEIFDSYGYYYFAHERHYRRRKIHDQYHFDCACQACLESWPTGFIGPYPKTTINQELQLFVQSYVLESSSVKVAKIKGIVEKYFKKIEKINNLLERTRGPISSAVKPSFDQCLLSLFDISFLRVLIFKQR